MIAKNAPDPAAAVDPDALGLAEPPRAFFRRGTVARRAQPRRARGSRGGSADAGTARGSSRRRRTSAPDDRGRALLGGPADGARRADVRRRRPPLRLPRLRDAPLRQRRDARARASPRPSCCARPRARTARPRGSCPGPGKLCAALGITTARQRARSRRRRVRSGSSARAPAAVRASASRRGSASTTRARRQDVAAAVLRPGLRRGLVFAARATSARGANSLPTEGREEVCAARARASGRASASDGSERERRSVREERQLPRPGLRRRDHRVLAAALGPVEGGVGLLDRAPSCRRRRRDRWRGRSTRSRAAPRASRACRKSRSSTRRRTRSATMIASASGRLRQDHARTRRRRSARAGPCRRGPRCGSRPRCPGGSRRRPDGRSGR